MNVDEKYGILAIRVKIATSTSYSSENGKNFKTGKQAGASTISMLYYCQISYKKYTQ